MKLTKKNVESLSFPEKEKLLWDSEIKGFGLKMTPSSKIYICQGRVNGKTRRVTIGKHGIFTLQQARGKAGEILQNMRNGIDPAAEKKKQKALSVTLREVSEAYIRDRDLKPRTITDIRRHVEKNFTSWEKRPVSEITRQKVQDRFRQITERSPAQANQAFRILRGLLSYARATYRGPDDEPLFFENPVLVLSDGKLWHRITPKNRRIPDDKVGDAYNFLMEQRAWPGHKHDHVTLTDGVLFMMLTGCRRVEALSLKWENVDLAAGFWHIVDPKNKNQITLPLNRQAQEILRERPRVDQHVFHSKVGKKGYVSDPRRVMEKLSDAIGVQVSAHDLRRTFRSIAGACNIELWKTKLLLNHKLTGDVTLESYTETSDCRYLAPEAQEIGDYVEKKAKIAKAGNVVEFNPAVREA